MRILLPQSEIADRELVQVLMAGGADVTALAVYRTVRASGDVELAPLLRAGQVDAVTFTSSSTARFFLERLDIEGHAPLDGVVFASIGPQTTRTARERGLKTVIEAEKHTLEGLVEALAATFGDSP
jgi:uroporphyrinogen III methyltransferase/synthase